MAIVISSVIGTGDLAGGSPLNQSTQCSLINGALLMCGYSDVQLGTNVTTNGTISPACVVPVGEKACLDYHLT